MAWIETRVLKQPWDVDRRLAELDLSRSGLLDVRAVALAEANNTTSNHCANAWGTFAYQHGTWALRDRFLGPNWVRDRTGGVEAIYNKAKKIRIAFCNVDTACDEDNKPNPRSDKGAGAEKVCEGNLFGHLPHYTKPSVDNIAMYYFMVAEGGACELSQPIIANSTFSSFVEQIYLSDGSDFVYDEPSFVDDNDAVTDFDPKIVRKD